VPFAFWLIAKCEPRLLVELGTHFGVSYAAFCEAVLRLRLGTSCYAVDTWEGDPHAGVYGEEVYAEVKAFHDKRYASFSQLVRRTFNDACGDFADGSIDLLHIDGFHTYHAACRDFETWRPKLSSRAVVLLHDTNERQHDFGVWRLFEELRANTPTFEFLHSHGLGVLAIGQNAPEAVRRLCELEAGAEIETVRNRFFLLGARWVAEQEKLMLAAEASSHHEMIGQKASQARELREAVSQKDAQVRALEEAASQKDAQAHALQLAVSELETRIMALQVEKERVVAEFERLTLALDSQKAELERASDLGRQLAVLRARPGAAFIDLLTYGLLSYLSRQSPPLSGRMTARFARSAEKRDPKRSLGQAHVEIARKGALPKRRPSAILDAQKETILIVSHEASRTGAPILALNIIQHLSVRYNVIGLILGGGELADHFRRASALLFVADRIHMTDRELDAVISDIAAQHLLTFAIVNSVESRMALRALKVAGVPTVSLVHEFSSYTRPRTAFPDVLKLSTETVFSTKMTLENAVADFWVYPGPSIHVVAQGKCTVPTTRGASEASVEKVRLTRNLRPEGATRKFLVIGLGDIQLRKGVDLFIECATIIKNQSGGERFQFVWIGNGFDPENEVVYSVYLGDQMKRAGLGSQMKILRSTSQIELAYQSADLLLLSSRLDPLPNVAIDALMLGLPVVCFEKTTGIADFLSETGLGEPCVAQYLDTHDLARKVTALADSEDLRASVSERSRAAAASAFDMNAYVSKIEAIAVQAVGAEKRVKEEINTILASGKFRGDFFKPPEMESSPEEKLVENYLRRMASGLHIRKPMPGFQPTIYSWLHRREGKTNDDPLADFLRKGLPQGPWLQSVFQNGGASKSAPHAGLRAALHLHVFYPDQLAGIVERVKLNASAPDLFISVTSEDAAGRTREALSGYRGHIIDVQVTPNLGRDIGPLLTQFGTLLSASYDVIGHLHTKRSVLLENPSFAEAWSAFLLENLVGGKRGGAMLDLILASMASDPAIGIVFPDDPHVLSWTGNRNHAEALAARMNCGELPEQFNFPIGAMFWMRAAVLKRFVELDLAWGDYEPEPLPYDGTLIHAIERLFGVVPAAMGMTCAVTNVRGVTR